MNNNQGKPWDDASVETLLRLAADHSIDMTAIATTLERSYPAVMKKLTKLVADMDYTAETCDKYRVKFTLVEKAARLRSKGAPSEEAQKQQKPQLKLKPNMANIMALQLEILRLLKQQS